MKLTKRNLKILTEEVLRDKDWETYVFQVLEKMDNQISYLEKKLMNLKKMNSSMGMPKDPNFNKKKTELEQLINKLSKKRNQMDDTLTSKFFKALENELNQNCDFLDYCKLIFTDLSIYFYLSLIIGDRTYKGTLNFEGDCFDMKIDSVYKRISSTCSIKEIVEIINDWLNNYFYYED